MNESNTRRTRMAEQSLQDALRLNRNFHNASFDQRFYDQLANHGVEVSGSVLVQFIPDGDNTYVGTLIKQDGAVFRFDIDLDLPDFSEWEDITVRFHEDVERLSKVKPWSREVVAKELFDRRGSHRP